MPIVTALREARLLRLHERFLNLSEEFGNARFAALTSDDRAMYASMLGENAFVVPAVIEVPEQSDEKHRYDNIHDIACRIRINAILNRLQAAADLFEKLDSPGE